MKVINQEILYSGDIDTVEKAIIVKSFEEYKNLGGTYDMLDSYNTIKQRAKSAEYKFISANDMYLSGIEITDDPMESLRKLQLKAQVWWTLLHMWFHKPLHKVSYLAFDLEEFSKL